MTYDVPVNGVSFGQVSFNLLRKAFEAGETPSLFPKGEQLDLGSYGPSPRCGEKTFNSLQKWLVETSQKSPERHSRSGVSLKLWHINGLLESFCKKQIALTFHETDSLTDFEANVLSEQEAVVVTSRYTKEVFESSGLTNVHYVPLGLDDWAFYKNPQPRPAEGVVTFGLQGKLEIRKHTLRILKAWVEEFGNDEKYRLNCTIFNPFLSAEDQEGVISHTLEGKRYFNVNFLPRQQKNSVYNSILNAIDIDLTGMSGCEGFNLPLFQSLCVGNHAVVLNAHVHKDFANEENSVLVEPSGMLPAADGKFFLPGQNINQGKWFDFEEGDLKKAMHAALARLEVSPVNEEGEKLKNTFTYGRTHRFLTDLHDSISES